MAKKKSVKKAIYAYVNCPNIKKHINKEALIYSGNWKTKDSARQDILNQGDYQRCSWPECGMWVEIKHKTILFATMELD